jgi:hypothetical protein
MLRRKHERARLDFTEQRGEKEKGTDISLRISEEFEKAIEWLLTGKE